MFIETGLGKFISYFYEHLASVGAKQLSFHFSKIDFYSGLQKTRAACENSA
jgi:hypothetical protein